MFTWKILVLLRLRSGFAAAATALLLAACGGGGGDDGDIRTIEPATPAFQGTWQVEANIDGTTTAAVGAAAAAVPTQQAAASLSATSLAQLIAATRFQGYTVTVNGSTLSVSDPDTNYALTINSFTVSDYQGCGACGVGTSVRYTVAMNFTESGTLDGFAIPVTTEDAVVRFTYTRMS